MRRAALALTALPIWACGLFTPEATIGRKSSDGVSPWEDLGQIRLCLGNERVGAAQSKVGGFCIGINKPVEDFCVEDSDCGTREACVCRRCTVQYCDGNSECGPGRACSFSEHRCGRACHGDAECPGPNEICSAGVCKGRCGNDDDCQYGELCSSQGRCTVAGCSDDSGCHADEICRIQRQPRLTAEPTVLADEDDGGFTMWLELEELGGDHSIWRATSQDGLAYQFDPAQPVVGGPGDDARAPSVLAGGGSFRMYFQRQGGIARADSPDGISFATPSLVIPGDYRAPAAVDVSPDETYLYVQAGDRQSIALWRGSGAPETVFAPAQVTDPVLWRDVTQVGSPFALLDTGPGGAPALHLWFDAFGQESEDSIQFGQNVPIAPNDSIGFASATVADPGMLVTYPFNPIFDRVVAFLDHRAERAPSVVRVPGEAPRYLLYYQGASADGTSTEGIGVAESPPAH